VAAALAMEYGFTDIDGTSYNKVLDITT